MIRADEEFKPTAYKSPTLAEIAKEYIEHGIGVIPLALDGTKKPILDWEMYKSVLPTIDPATAWFRQQRGMGVICGAVSRGLEVFDFDREADRIFPLWHRLVESIAVRLPIVETPGGGYHAYYRCEVCCGSKKIARISANEFNAEKMENNAAGITEKVNATLIETRGEGGYVVGPSSPAAVHLRNYPYVQVAGPVLPEIPTITPAERLMLWRAARSFDRSGLLEKEVRQAMPRPYRQVEVTGDEKTRFERARRYVAKLPPSISGDKGHDKAFHAACVLVRKFGLSFDPTLQLMNEFNDQCQPPWSDRELRHKVESAMKVSA